MGCALRIARPLRAWLVTAALAVTFLWAMAVPVSAGPPTPTPATTATAQAMYYVVGDPRDGQRETLFSIAAATLGNGNRYPEIVALNRGRLQPDGGQLTDASVIINPGWVLLLPADATGPGVQVGTDPLLASPPAGHAGPAAEPAAAGAGPTKKPLIQKVFMVTVIVLVALVLVVALLLLRQVRGRRRDLPRPPSPVTDLPSNPGSSRPVESVALPVPQRPAQSAVPLAPRRPAVPVATLAPQRPTESAAPLAPRRAPSPLGARASQRPAAPPPVVLAGPVGPSTVRRLSTLDTVVSDGDDSLVISLVGRRDSLGSSPYRWVGVGEPLDPAPDAVPVTLGTGPQGTLMVDLARTPDLITITGPPDRLRRQARRLAEQLARAGVRVSAIAGTFGEPEPPGTRLLTGLDEAGSAAAPDGASPQVLFCPGEWDSGSLGRRLSRRSSTDIVILIGSSRRSRWCIDVRPRGTAAR